MEDFLHDEILAQDLQHLFLADGGNQKRAPNPFLRVVIAEYDDGFADVARKHLDFGLKSVVVHRIAKLEIGSHCFDGLIDQRFDVIVIPGVDEQVAAFLDHLGEV